MTKTSKTVVFFGSGPVAATSLDFMRQHFNIEAVVTKTKPSHHRGSAPVEELAKAHKLPLYFANSMRELDGIVTAQKFTSPVGVIIDYGVMVSEQTIAHFPLGIINSHFSLLPEWRGADPITFSILSGQPKTGVSLMLIEPELDTGKLLVRKSIKIDPSDTIASLTERLVVFSNQLLLEVLPAYIEGNVKPQSQPHPDRATYSRKLEKADGIIDWNKPAEVLEREVRAFLGWPGSRTQLAGKDVIITKTHIEPVSGEPGSTAVLNKQLLVFCGKDALAIDMLKPAGKKEMTGAAFIAGHKQLLI